MSRLILHVGPGKCGSTTIQNFFAAVQPPIQEATRLHFFAPSEFVDLDHGQATQARLAQLDALITAALNDADVAILSHEFLFQTPQAAGIIAQRMRKVCDDVRVIGYVRSQSSLLLSTYSQWLFRAKTRVEAVVHLLKDSGLSPSLFTGLERQFIAAILDDFHSARQLSGYRLLDLWTGYRSLEAAVSPSPLSVGGLPKGENDTPLLADFCARADLTLIGAEPPRANSKFNAGLVDALNAATVLKHIELNPHSGNEDIQRVSERLPEFRSPSATFFEQLRDYVDAYHSADNAAMAAHFSLPQDYFSKPSHADKEAIIAVIHTEQERRITNPEIITDYFDSVAASLSSDLSSD